MESSAVVLPSDPEISDDLPRGEQSDTEHVVPEEAPEARLSRRLRIDLGYHGAPFNGWATQPGLPTVQNELEVALQKIIRRPVRTVVAGRTDTGVHARKQTVHIDLTPEEFTGLTRGRPGLEPLSTLVRRLNGTLKHHQGAIVVYSAQLMPDGFDARFSPIWRRYIYRVHDQLENFDPLTKDHVHWHQRRVDVDLMVNEIKPVIGLHDFLSFCKPRATGTTIREVIDFDVSRQASGLIVFRITADAFCHHMVRALVGAAIQVGDGTRAPGWLQARLLNPVRDSHMQLAAPHGLTLDEVGYPDHAQLEARAQQTRAKRPNFSSPPQQPPAL